MTEIPTFFAPFNQSQQSSAVESTRSVMLVVERLVEGRNFSSNGGRQKETRISHSHITGEISLYTVCVFIHPSKELCSKMAQGEGGVSLQ